MCLAIPGRVIALTREHDVLMGKVAFGGVTRQVCLEHVPEAQPGDYVLVHVGFALCMINEVEAARTWALREEIAALDDELGAPR